ncbi:MAG: metalloregulator ArsR/SmtB family transcription factor [Micropruina sp.]|uniref:ArsR/SmtB family transcription factor n=1 Tax=Micropruina sp. TaxID=2737536 RepID=UPI0039E6D40A
MTDQLDAAFAALSDPTRRDLVARLAIGDATVGELAAPYDMTIQAISKHLNVLVAAGLVSKRPQAQRRLVHLETDALRRLTDWVEHYARLAEQRYRRLDDVLAALPENRAAAAPPLEGETS